MELKNKIVLVTGSSQGIGKAIALEFAKMGARVIITYNANKQKAEENLEKCKKFSECLLVHLDITSEDSIIECVKKIIDKFGAIDILINNAGIISWKSLIEQSSKEIDLQIDTNLRGLIKMTKITLPYLLKQNEAIIINVSSGAGKRGTANITLYCATKFGVRGFTESLSQEVPKNVKIYSLNPGKTATKMTDFIGNSPENIANLIVEVVKENIKIKSGEDIDLWRYLQDDHS